MKEIRRVGWTPDLLEFRKFYGIDDAAVSWTWDSAKTQDASVAYHVFESASEQARKGTAFLIHGYLEHTALRAGIAAALTAAGWLVVGIDLPGHGLSSGPRADVARFTDYADALDAVANARDWPAPRRVLAHSTGCAATLMSRVRRPEYFSYCVFEAPLVRTAFWEPSIFAHRLMRKTVKAVPRYNGGLPASQRYARLTREDPLYEANVPIHWFEALREFYEDIIRWEKMPGDFLVLQGTRDTVVDADFNMPFLKRLLPGAEFRMIPGGRHHLLVDSGPTGILARAILAERWGEAE